MLPIRRFWLAFTLLLILTSLPTPALSQSDPRRARTPVLQDVPFAVPDDSESWETRLLHIYKTTIEVPSSWWFYEGNHTFYDPAHVRGLLLRIMSHPPDQTFEAQCEEAARRYSQNYKIDYQPETNPTVCIIESPEFEWGHALLRLPEPYQSPGSDTPVDTLWWFAHKSVLPRIVDSVSFEPPSAALYLEEALHVLEENFIFADQIDWSAVREKALGMLDANSTYEDAHDALASVFTDTLDPLDNAHSTFESPEANAAEAEGNALGRGYQAIWVGPTEKRLITLIYPGSPADRAGLRPGDVMLTVNGQTFADFVDAAQAHPEIPVPATLTFQVVRPGEAEPFSVDLTREEFDATLPVSGRRLDNGIAYVETYSVGNMPTEDTIAYATRAQEVIAELDTPAACGWIVDVRRNPGGEVLSMALAAAPLWGEGDFLRMRDVRGVEYPWSYEDGVITHALSPQADETVVADPYTIQNPDAPMAVLISQETASMGEATARAVMNRPNATTRTFGEQTRGWDMTLLTYFTLYDYARMNFSNAVLLDQNGNPITGPIEPDVPMAMDYTVYGSDADPVIQAAAAWLRQQPECAADG